MIEDAKQLILEYEIIFFEIISRKKSNYHLKTSRFGLNVRRLANLALAPIPLINLWVVLAEIGIVKFTEKRTFIRFQGLTTIHIGRITKKAGSSFFKDELRHIQADFSGASESEYSNAYVNLIATEAALVVAGYIIVNDDSKFSSSEISKLSKSIMTYRFSTKGTGVWDRFKSSLGAAIYLGIPAAIFPLASYLGHFNILTKNNTLGHIRDKASRYLEDYLKRRDIQ